MISMSVGCLMAYQKVIRIKEQVPHQSASANFRLPWIRCLRFQKNFYGSVSTCGQVRGLHIPQWCSVTHFPHCPPRRPWHHGQTGMHVHVLPPPADSLCPNQMHRNVTRRNNLCRNKSTRIAVLSCYKKTESPENVAFIKNLRKRNWLFKIGTVTPVLIWRITTKSGVETHMRAILGDPGSFHIE